MTSLSLRETDLALAHCASRAPHTCTTWQPSRLRELDARKTEARCSLAAESETVARHHPGRRPTRLRRRVEACLRTQRVAREVLFGDRDDRPKSAASRVVHDGVFIHELPPAGASGRLAEYFGTLFAPKHAPTDNYHDWAETEISRLPVLAASGSPISCHPQLLACASREAAVGKATGIVGLPIWLSQHAPWSFIARVSEAFVDRLAGNEGGAAWTRFGIHCIPKMQHPLSFADRRPISLISFSQTWFSSVLIKLILIECPLPSFRFGLVEGHQFTEITFIIQQIWNLANRKGPFGGGCFIYCQARCSQSV
jgi:hypothetical protein